jgi:hypothetical protein
MSEHPVLWYLGNAKSPLFTHADMLELQGSRLTDDTLQNWANRKIVAPEIEGGNRRYDSVETGCIALMLPLVHDLRIMPAVAKLMAMMATTLMTRNLVDPKKVKPKAGDVPLNDVQNFYCIFGGIGRDLPTLVHKRDLVETTFRKTPACTVLGFGRILIDVVKRAQKLADSRRVATITNDVSDMRELALVALGKGGEID